MIAATRNASRLVRFTSALKAAGWCPYVTGPSAKRFLKNYRVKIAAVTESERGSPVYLIDQEEHDRLVEVLTKVAAERKLRRAKAEAKEAKASSLEQGPTPSTDDPQLHIIALEKQVADLKVVVAGNTQAINELIKSGNLLCDRLNKVLVQLGATEA